MFWMKKQEIELEDNSKKIVLERITILGKRQRLKFIETRPPSLTRSPETNVMSITRRRKGWRFRITYPIITIYYKKNSKGEWSQIGTALPTI